MSIVLFLILVGFRGYQLTMEFLNIFIWESRLRLGILQLMISWIVSCVSGRVVYCLNGILSAYIVSYLLIFDYFLLGYSWRDNLYFDVRLFMGFYSVVMVCQRVINVICFMFFQVGCQVLSYLDDFMVIFSFLIVFKYFVFSGFLLRDLGLQEFFYKVCLSLIQMICLGVFFDIVNFIMFVIFDRLRVLQEDLLFQWLYKRFVIKRELQFLIGKLVFVCKCVYSGRLFLCRILDILYSLRRNYYRIKLFVEFRKDIRCWIRFISVYNGVFFIFIQIWFVLDSIFFIDVCLIGCGGMIVDEYFYVLFFLEVFSCFFVIYFFEVLVIIVVFQLWGYWRGQRIIVYCDNFFVVSS